MLPNFDVYALEGVLHFGTGFPFTLMAILCHRSPMDSTREEDEGDVFGKVDPKMAMRRRLITVCPMVIMNSLAHHPVKC
jgi:hypothetical protein